MTAKPELLYDPDGAPMRLVWRVRKVREETRPAGWFLANSRNWRTHPAAQREALRGVLGSLGWLDSVKVNLRTSPQWGDEQGIPVLWDGHARIEEALKVGDDTAVPLEYYDLTPAEEDEALATFDPLSAMAGTDPAALDALLRDVATDSPAVAAMLDALAQEAGIVEGIPLDDAFGALPDGDRAPFQQMTFTLSDGQAERVKQAIEAAKDAGPFEDMGNENSNGNALARIVEAYLG